MSDAPYREFLYPLNVFMHILTHEEGDVPYLHYGLFEHGDERIGVAQERSTELLLSRLPPPPRRILEVGIGAGTTLARLAERGYGAEGITPDEQQIAVARSRFPSIRVQRSAFETFTGGPYDLVLFQESSQYIEAGALFAKARELTNDVVVLDEFAVPAGVALHRLDRFLAAAAVNGFRKIEDLDLSRLASPTVDYFLARLPRYRDSLIADLGITSESVDELIESGLRYREMYASGQFVYRLMRFIRP